MNTTIREIINFWETSFGRISFNDHPFFILDILLVAVIFYYLYIWSRKTRIIPVISGLVILGISFLIARVLNLEALEWILDKVLTMMVIAIPIVFSDEIKKFLEKIGQTKFSSKYFNFENFNWIDEIISFANKATNDHIGALIVLERKSILTEYIESGTILNCHLSKEILYSIFHTKSPLHDGAVIIRDGYICAAKCILPISREIIEDVGTRHRAGVAVADKSDAIAIIISEEKKEISVAMDGKIIRNIDEKELRSILLENFSKSQSSDSKFINTIKDVFHAKES